MMTTFKKLDNDHLELEIYGEITGDQQYVAVGFSTDSEMVCIYYIPNNFVATFKVLEI